MSHHHERKIKVCLNCGSEVHGRYCHVCGQENIEPKESFIGLVSHFFNDITHFDGSFFKSLKYLVLKPGFLSTEWTKGRRASYLHPVRMYIFTSAVFFLAFFSVFHFDEEVLPLGDKSTKETKDGISEANRKAINAMLKGLDSSQAAQAREALKNDSANNDIDEAMSGFNAKVATSPAAYDSMQALLPARSRDGWIKRQLHYKFIKDRQAGKYQEQVFWRRLLNKFLHQLPQLLFVSLPLYALMLKLLYIRRRDLYYSDHAIYSIHIFVFRFIALLAIIGFSQMKEFTGWNWIGWFPTIIIIIYMVLYNLVALKRFYGQRWSKTLLKSFLLATLAAFMVLCLFVLFAMLSFFQI